MMKNIEVTSSPHLRDSISTKRIMQEVCLALAPAGIVGIVQFGFRAAGLMAACVICCVLFEYLFQRISHQKITIGDWSAVVTGLLLAYNLPANAPVWIAVIGSALAIILVKQFFGGLGCNFMNPALTARAILFVSWALLMTSYPQNGFNVDAVSAATPLAMLKNGASADVSIMNLLLGSCGGVLGETCKLAIIAGGVYLIVRKIADWRIPVFFIMTTFVCYLIRDNADIALKEILSGGLMLGAFFMATDYVTSPMTDVGRIIMGVGCGLLVFVIRSFTNSAEGCSFAILFMNVMTPLIDRFTVGKIFGEGKKNG